MSVPLPYIKEQEKIVNLFSTLDQIISACQSEVDAWERQKKGVMQQLFSQKIRFKDDDGNDYPKWQTCKIKDLFFLIRDVNKDEKVKNVITNSAEFGLIPQRNFFDKDIAIEGNTQNYIIIRKDDFVYNPRKSQSAPYGPFNRYNGEQEGIVSPLYFCLRLNYPEVSSYLEYYFASNKWYRYIYNHGAQGGARHDRVGMTNELLMDIPIIIPCFEEQQKIASCLSAFDEVIDKSKKELEKYQELKKGLMRQMFV